MNTISLLFNSFLRIWAVLSTQLRRSVVWLFILMLVLAVFELVSILSLSFFASILNSPDAVLRSRYFSIVQEFFPSLAMWLGDVRHLLLGSVLVPIILIVLKNITNAVVTWKTSTLGGEVAGYVGCEIMSRFIFMPYDWHISSLSADAFTKMSWRYALGQLLVQNLVAYSNLITTCLLFLGLFLYAPGLTMLVLFVMAISCILLYNNIRHHIDKNSTTLSQAQGEEARATMTAVRGIREILIYQQQPVFIEAIKKAVQKGIRPQAFLGTAPAVPSWLLESVGFLLIGIVLAFMVLIQDASNTRIVANIAMLTLTAWRVLPSMNRTVGAIVNIRANQPMGLPCLEYMESLKEAPREHINQPKQNLLMKHEIRLENVHYRYSGAQTDSLCGVTIDIPIGKCIGIIGKSGAGKSTLINIISGLFMPTQGRLLVDGKELTPASLIAYRQQIGYVAQNPYLMAGTVRDNIAFSTWGQPSDEARLKLASQLAGIDFLDSNQEGMDRLIGENGAGLSGGQAQRITIARALYCQPSILIFDEATSSLDHMSEEKILQTIRSLPRDMTQIIIAHKLTILQDCDLVYWLEDGRVVRHGTPNEILPHYKTASSSENENHA